MVGMNHSNINYLYVLHDAFSLHAAGGYKELLHHVKEECSCVAESFTI